MELQNEGDSYMNGWRSSGKGKVAVTWMEQTVSGHLRHNGGERSISSDRSCGSNAPPLWMTGNFPLTDLDVRHYPCALSD